MPRARKPPGTPVDPRGGVRVGTPGTPYPGRSDLRAQPIRTAPNQAYGEAGQQAAAQRAIPLPQSPPPPTVATQPSMAPQGGGGPLPGSFGAFNRPTERPAEPVTHGLPGGPGAGPEVLPQLGAANLGDLLHSLASGPGATPDVAYLAAYLRGQPGGGR